MSRLHSAVTSEIAPVSGSETYTMTVADFRRKYQWWVEKFEAEGIDLEDCQVEYLVKIEGEGVDLNAFLEKIFEQATRCTCISEKLTRTVAPIEWGVLANSYKVVEYRHDECENCRRQRERAQQKIKREQKEMEAKRRQTRLKCIFVLGFIALLSTVTYVVFWLK